MVITIGRQFGSQGRDIGCALADALGVEFFDKERLRNAAQNNGVSPELFDKYDEKASNSLLYSLSLGASATISSEYGISPEAPVNDKLYLIAHKTILSAAEKPCVIVGRCADHILADRKDLLSVFVYGNADVRLRHIAEKFGVSADKARTMIKKNDRARAYYYNNYTSRKWGEPSNYHLLINSSVFGVQGSAQLIADAVRARGLL